MHNTLSTTIRRRNRRNANGSFGLGTTTPSYAWDFVNNKARFNSINYGALANTPGWSFTRASTGYAQTSAGALTAFASGELRRTDKGVLIEGARTNLCLQSQTFDNASWTKANLTVTADQAVAPDGTTTADTITPNTGNSQKVCYQGFTATAVAYSQSVYVKSNGGQWIGLSWNTNAATDGAFFDVINGVVGTVAASGTATILALGNGWYRCTIVRTLAAATRYCQVEPHSADNQSDTWNSAAGAEKFYIWGAQAELGAFPSSYIPTTTASATRAADVLTVPVSGIDFPLSLYSEIEMPLLTSAQGYINLVGDNVAGVNGAGHYYDATNSSRQISWSGSVLQGNPSFSTMSANTVYKHASRFATNSLRGARNGTLNTEDTSATNPATPTFITLGYNGGGFFYLRRAALWTRALTDAELQAVTT